MLIKPRQPQRSAIAKLHFDALDIILEHLYLNEYDSLLVLSRVCRDLYLAATPWIYREVKINFGRPTHMHLLSRLAQHTRLPSYIRTLSSRDHEKAEDSHTSDMYKLFEQLRNVVSVDWSSTTPLPQQLVSILTTRSPEASDLLKTNGIVPSLNWSPSFGNRRLNPGMSQLKALRLMNVAQPKTVSAFKTQLIHLLTCNRGLQTLAVVSGGPADDRAYPDRSLIMQSCDLPHLRQLCLLIAHHLFKPQELACWGNQDGWNELESLTLTWEADLRFFVGKVPKLERLRLDLRFDRSHHNLEDVFRAHPHSPLGILRHLDYRSWVHPRIGKYVCNFAVQGACRTISKIPSAQPFERLSRVLFWLYFDPRQEFR